LQSTLSVTPLLTWGFCINFSNLDI
jgi:hypothetical protein